MKTLARLATIATLAAALVGASAASALAYPGWRHAGSYGWPDHCLGVGYQGKQSGSWTNYFCETITPANPASGPGFYKLWVQ